MNNTKSILKKVGVGTGLVIFGFVGGVIIKSASAALTAPTIQSQTVKITPKSDGTDDILIKSLQEVVKYNGNSRQLNDELKQATEEKARCLEQWTTEENRLNKIKSDYELEKAK